ncbi:MAG: hypothetical protein IPH31_09660 [Lewinellaceae bacterium]|nr:hypothetical protein [Lewinellaceae bacterium]
MSNKHTTLHEGNIHPPLHYLPDLGFISFAQAVNFKKGLRNADPIPTESTISVQVRVKAHQDFLDQAARNQDPQKQIYGFIFLVQDYLRIRTTHKPRDIFWKPKPSPITPTTQDGKAL